VGLQGRKKWQFWSINRQNLAMKQKVIKQCLKRWLSFRKTVAFVGSQGRRGAKCGYLGGFSGHGRFQLFGGLQNGNLAVLVSR